MKARSVTALLFVIVGSLLVALPGGRPALAVGGSAQSTVAPRSTLIPGSRARGSVQGTVLGARVNVRRSPSTSSPIVGVVRQGNRVQITGRQTGWLQIAFPAGPGGLGWVSATLVAVDGDPTATPRTQSRPRGTPRPPTSAAVPAPRTIAYNDPTFTWEWRGANQVGGADWYFDIQFFRSSGQDPYFILAAEPTDAILTNGIWTFTHRVSPDCGSYWVVQIAKRVNGVFSGWISPKSNRSPIGEVCDTGSADDGGDDSTPEPAPTDTPCPDC